MIQRFARFFSAMFSPMIMPAYGIFLALWTTILCYNPLGTRLIVLAVMFAITCVLPILFISLLFAMKVLKDKNLVKREERLLPYIGFIVSFFASLWYLASVHSPMWLMSAMYGVILAAIVSFAVNSLLKWKISAHMTGIGGIIGMLYTYHNLGLGAFNLFWLICIFILVAGVLGSARIILERHTLLQVLAGFVNGIVCMSLCMAFLLD